jgi:aspartyl-tRNA(Asn)/glutamyl-tRNA(Gln) amidotransferase subunit A
MMGASMDLREVTALQISSLLREKKVSSPEVTRVFLDAAKKDMEKSNGVRDKLNAYISIDEEGAMAAAAETQSRIDSARASDSTEVSPLTGVPIALKDNICVRGTKTTAASKILATIDTPSDATVTEKLNAAGAVIIGKTNLDEFAMGGSTETSYFGPARNPWNTEKVPGGSSGGSAVAVSGGLAPISVGSDTGGSIRQPAAFCNLTGLKPTYGAVSRYGLLAYASSLDQIGPIGYDARDCAAVYSILAGKDLRDSTSTLEKRFEFKTSISEASGSGFGLATIKNLRVGVPRDYLDKGLMDDVKNVILNSAEELRSMGAIVEEIDLPLIHHAVPAYYVIACAEASSNLSRYDGVKYGYRSSKASDMRESYFISRSEGFGTEVKRRIMLGSFVLSSGYFDAYYKKALQVRSLIKDAYEKTLAKYDIILGPVTPTVAYDLGDQIQDPLAMYMADVYTVPANLTGLPAISLPCGTSVEGMPIGMQLMGKAFSEELLLSIGAEYQSQTTHHLKRASR